MAIHNKDKMTDSELVSKVNAEVSLCNTQSESYLSDQRINSNYSFATSTQRIHRLLQGCRVSS